MKPSYMILGANGVIGTAVQEWLEYNGVDDYRIFPFIHSEADICNQRHIQPLIEYIKPTVVINCAGISDPERCEEDPDLAFKVNTKALRILGTTCSALKTKLIHFSSWGVFGGDREQPFNEKSPPNPVNIYGQSKSTGEHILLSHNPNALIIRSGWIFSEHEKSPIHDWLFRASEGLNIKVRQGKAVSPVYATDLIEATMELLHRRVNGGIYHIANPNPTSIEEFAQKTLKIADYDPDLVKTMGDNRFKAPFPRNSSMTCSKYRQVFNKNLRPWAEALKECLFVMKKFSP